MYRVNFLERRLDIPNGHFEILTFYLNRSSGAVCAAHFVVQSL